MLVSIPNEQWQGKAPRGRNLSGTSWDISGTARPFHLFLLEMQDIWVCDQEMNRDERMREEYRISAFTSWYLYVGVLNNIGLRTFCIRPPKFVSEKKLLEHVTDGCFLLRRCVPLD